jgi:cytochrome c-type biogenesis protein CcmH
VIAGRGVRRGMRVRTVATRALQVGAAVATAVAVVLTSAGAVSATPRTSLPTIERQVMCVTCKIPLNVAQSPQADRERAFIQSLIDRGAGETQVKHALVGQYGPAVLALPSDSGFDATAYLVPLAAFVLALGALAVLLPRWRRRARTQAALRTPSPTLDTADARRLDADLKRFD